jgi:hypothetical protein
MTHEKEPIAHLTFEAVPFDLTSLPTNEQDAKARLLVVLERYANTPPPDGPGGGEPIPLDLAA